ADDDPGADGKDARRLRERAGRSVDSERLEPSSLINSALDQRIQIDPKVARSNLESAPAGELAFDTQCQRLGLHEATQVLAARDARVELDPAGLLEQPAARFFDRAGRDPQRFHHLLEYGSIRLNVPLELGEERAEFT